MIPDAEDTSAMRFVSEYLRSAGRGGGPFLQELNLICNEGDDVLCLADALLHGGDRGSAPNLEEIIFEVYGDVFVNGVQLGQLFARGALANITTLEFSGIAFQGEDMTNLMNDLKRSGHQGRTIRKLVFTRCNVAYDEDSELILDDVEEVSLALIAGLRAGNFPNLQELLMPHGALLVRQVPELVEALREGAPCARTLNTVVISTCLPLGPVDIAALRAVLPQATVTCE
jgi:hypothetical protein